MSSAKTFSLFMLILVLKYCCMADLSTSSQSQFFVLMNISNWDSNRVKDYCNYTGILCDDQKNIFQVDISDRSLDGEFPGEVCSYLPKLRVLRAGNNKFRGGFPRGIINCSFLEELNMSSIYFTGPLPDFSLLKKSLRILDLSYNHFSDDFPISVANLTNLEFLNFNENPGFHYWEIPESISRLNKLKTMILATCSIIGEIPSFLGNMTSLIDLELSGNNLTGRIPKELGLLKNLQHLELYYNQLEGEIPSELGNLTEIRDLDMSVNNLGGNIPESICKLPYLKVFQLYTNILTGPIPSVLANSTTLNTLSLYGNFLTGNVPQNLGTSSAIVAIDLSENYFSGRLPPGLCSGGGLNYLLVLKNNFSGELPESYRKCKSLVRFRVSLNNLSGDLPDEIFSLPYASIIDVAYNHFTGIISKDIGNARNLSQLFMQGNRISGVIPSEISLAVNLVKIDLSNNLISGVIPTEIGKLGRLNLLLLQGNKLSSHIPESLSFLNSLNFLDLSNNQLTGNIPESLSKLLPNSLNFSNNQLSGPIPVPFIKGGLLESFSGNPGLCVPVSEDSSLPNFSLCGQTNNRKKTNHIWLIVISVGIVFLGAILFLRKWIAKDRQVKEDNDQNTQSSSFFSYDVKSFHRLSFDQREIVEAMTDKNIVGYGGSGTVYRIELNNGEVVAVKKLWGNRKANFEDISSSTSSDGHKLILDKELKNEVETLGCVRHKNIVKLYCYFSSMDCSLLVYEYMPNGNLWDALHRGKMILDWPTRHQIALGIAQGLAYLHHDLMPPIIHRDIKSTNILLDVNYQAKVADFGIAKVLQAMGSKDSTTTVIAGTYGYLAPEYAYSSKATNKCDVYSFGVVLMELITGKKPVEAEFGDNKNIIYWVSTKLDTKEGAMEVLDKRVSEPFKDEMIKVLRIAIRCTCKTATLRPSMNEVVQQLIEADPCKFDCYKSSNKNAKETTKPKNMQFD